MRPSLDNNCIVFSIDINNISYNQGINVEAKLFEIVLCRVNRLVNVLSIYLIYC